MRSVGLIGLGSMGMPMLLSLLRASERGSVHAFSRSPAKLQAAEEHGAIVHETARGLAEASDVIVSVLPDLPELEELLAAREGIIAGIASPTFLVICSTCSPQGVRRLQDQLTEVTGGLVTVIDAPVSGGVEGARDGSLSIMVGGEAADFAAVESVLAAMGNPVLLGCLGAGQIAKACNQLVVAATALALGEAVVIAERSGLDLRKLLDLLSGGYAGSRVLETKKDKFVNKDYAASGRARFLIKDLGFAREEAERTGTRARELDLLHRVFTELTEAGFGESDIAVTAAYVDSVRGAL